MDGTFFYYFIFDEQNYLYFGDLLSVRALYDGYNLKNKKMVHVPLITFQY